jgi:hypothetical protein
MEVATASGVGCEMAAKSLAKGRNSFVLMDRIVVDALHHRGAGSVRNTYQAVGHTRSGRLKEDDMKDKDFSAERMAEVFLAYLFRNKTDDRHVRRVASWLGLLILGIEEIKDIWWVSHTRQLCFEFDGRRFKARYNHRLKPHGGIEIVEVEPKPGQPDIGVARAISNLKEAAKFFRSPKL